MFATIEINTVDALQYFLRVSEDEYVYFEYDFERNQIHEEHIRYQDITKEEIVNASETFGFNENNYCEAQKNQLAIELKFESGLT